MTPRFDKTYCSHCGGEFGHGDHGYSHCEDHRPQGWPPFREGQIVRIKGNDHLGLHRIETCEWYVPSRSTTKPYWLCECEEIREPIDWSKIPAGATGIITSSSWRGSADHLIPVQNPKCDCGAVWIGKWADRHSDSCPAVSGDDQNG